jgi:hypothetical protein
LDDDLPNVSAEDARKSLQITAANCPSINFVSIDHSLDRVRPFNSGVDLALICPTFAENTGYDNRLTNGVLKTPRSQPGTSPDVDMSGHPEPVRTMSPLRTKRLAVSGVARQLHERSIETTGRTSSRGCER